MYTVPRCQKWLPLLLPGVYSGEVDALKHRMAMGLLFPILALQVMQERGFHVRLVTSMEALDPSAPFPPSTTLECLLPPHIHSPLCWPMFWQKWTLHWQRQCTSPHCASVGRNPVVGLTGMPNGLFMTPYHGLGPVVRVFR